MATFRGTSAANTIYGTASADFIYGMAGNDTIYGRGGADTIDAGAGNDRIIGGAGADQITSGTGADVIVYTSVSDSPFNGDFNAIDFIKDWNPMDSIDLTAIDANSLVAGNQAFTFAGYFFGTPIKNLGTGQLAIGGFGGELYIFANTDADSAWEFGISLFSSSGEAGLTASDIFF